MSYILPKRYTNLKRIRNIKLYHIAGNYISLHELAYSGNFNDLIQVLNLYKSSINLNEYDRQGITPLHYAARKGSKECFSVLLEHGSDLLLETKQSKSNIIHCVATSGNNELLTYIFTQLNKINTDLIKQLTITRNINGKLPAHCAAQSGNIELFKRLYIINKKYHLSFCKTHDGRSFHHLAAERGNFELLKFLYNNNDFKQQEGITNIQHNIVHHAARSGNIDLLKFTVLKMKESNCDPFIQNQLGWTPIFMAAMSFNTDIIDYCLHENIDINSTGVKVIRTPIVCAAQYGSYKMVKYMIEHGANPTPSNINPLLHFAAEGGSIELLKYLLFEVKLQNQLLIDSNILRIGSRNIFHFAVSSGDTNTLRYLIEDIMPEYPEMNKLLEECSYSPLEEACRTGNFEAVVYLLEHNYNIKYCKEGLYKAIINRYLDITTYLLDNYFKQDSKNLQILHKLKDTILHIIVKWCNDISFIKDEIIIKRNFNPNQLDSNSNSALFYALKTANVPISKMLLNEYLPQNNKTTKYLFHAAVMGGNITLLELLLSKLPYIKNQKEETYRYYKLGYITPLHLAVNEQHFDMVKYLCEKLHCSITCSENGLTPLHLACNPFVKFTRCQEDILTYLIIHSGWKYLLHKVNTYPGISGTQLTTVDVASSPKIRYILEKYSPDIRGSKLLVDANEIQIFYNKPLGEGQNGRVFMGEYKYTPVAIKVFTLGSQINSNLIEDKATILRLKGEFLKELGLMSSVRHPNLIMIMAGVEKNENEFLLVIEKMKRSLQDYLEELCNTCKPMPLSRLQQISLEICYGMLALHSHTPTILHCDLKPSNILLDDSNHAKISDFGISRLEFMGGTYYDKIVPPEVTKDNLGKHSIVSDIYMFGLCLISMCARYIPKSYTSLLNDIPSLTPCVDLQKIMQKCCQENPKDRYQSFDKVLFDLKNMKIIEDNPNTIQNLQPITSEQGIYVKL